MIKSTGEVLGQSNRAAVQFLFTDLATGFAFLDVCEPACPEETRKRNLQHARDVYELVVRLLPRAFPTTEERMILDARLSELKRRLVGLGCVFESELFTQRGSQG